MKIKLLINTAYGKVGDIVNVGVAVGERLITTKQAEPVNETDNKAIHSDTTKRGPGRPRKVAIDDKAIA